MASTDWLSQGTLVLASNNKGKIAEFEKMFAELKLPVEVIPQGKLNIEDAIEDGLSFVENAIIKARHASRISGKPAIADDSGICVPVLGGAPGIYSARYAGEHGNDALFWLPELGISSAEMSKEEKNKISHRGQAMKLFKASLEK